MSNLKNKSETKTVTDDLTATYVYNSATGRNKHQKEKRGYNAVKIGFFKLKNSKLTKQMKGYFAKKNTEPKKILKEFRVENNNDFKFMTEPQNFNNMVPYSQY